MKLVWPILLVVVLAIPVASVNAGTQRICRTKPAFEKPVFEPVVREKRERPGQQIEKPAFEKPRFESEKREGAQFEKMAVEKPLLQQECTETLSRKGLPESGLAISLPADKAKEWKNIKTIPRKRYLNSHHQLKMRASPVYR